MTQKQWSADLINQLIRGFQPACVIVAAADLDLFTALSARPATALELAKSLGADLRALTVLLDALAAMELLQKQGDRYEVPASVAEVLVAGRPGNQLAMAQHQGNCLRRWAQLAAVVEAGRPAAKEESIRGAAADYGSFIEAMDNISGPAAGPLVAALPPLAFRHLLDVGGASGTWTIAFLRANPAARATIFDLPQVIPQAKERLSKAGMADRVNLVPGDFYVDPLPKGADLAWVSAIVHQNSRQQNRDLFARVFEAIEPGGQVLIRDILMEDSRTAPIAGALFAVNMLVATPHGGTFTFGELSEDLASAGFVDSRVLKRDEGMQSVVSARKP